MKDERKTKKQLIEELDRLRDENTDLREKVAGVDVSGAERQLAVERIRAEAMTMQQSDDLYALSCSFLVEVRQLGIDTWYLSIALIEDDRIVRYYYAQIDQDNKVNIRDRPPDEMPERWRMEKLRAHRTKKVSTYYNESDRCFIHNIPIPQGIVGFAEPINDAQNLKTMVQLAEAFSLGFVRFLDFQRLEDRNRALEQANEAKSRFLANMSHEIRTPMNAILGFAQVLERGEGLSADQRQSVETIHRSGTHLLRLINDVLDISQIEAGRMELNPTDFDLRALIKDLGVMFALRCEQKRLGWKLEGVGNEPVHVRGDDGKLSQVLINLLGNAVKFTAEGEVVLRFTDLGEHRYRFDVVDTGPGIAAEEQSELFQPFQQGESGRRHEGTGLGLAIAQKQLEVMGSQLQLESTPDKGSRFFFELAFSAVRGEVASTDARSWTRVRRLAAGHEIQVLVVDDVEENRDILTRLLEEIGVDVRTVPDGTTALEQVRSSRPDLVFMDIRMPGMDGEETTRRLWEEWGRDTLKVVAISASALEHERRKYIDFGFEAFIDKPFSAERIYECLAELLGAEYEYDAPLEAAGAEPLLLKGFAIPGDLLQRLRTAAETGNVTGLDRELDAVAALGPTGGALAARLRHLGQELEMDGVLETLADVESA